MRLSLFFSVILLMAFTLSCNNNPLKNDIDTGQHKILQEEDGSVSLEVDRAACYSDKVNPSDNTADWDFIISKPGRFKVWLSSAAKDTSLLYYKNSVRISLMDKFLVAKPLCDKIILNSSDVNHPFYIADSYVGSIFIPESGQYNLQVISDKIVSTRGTANSFVSNDSWLISVNLTPELQ
jgi:hypothetical protein